jgi:hypothetical protein
MRSVDIVVVIAVVTGNGVKVGMVGVPNGKFAAK